MPRSRRFERVALSVLLLAALLAFAVQLVVDQPVLGALGATCAGAWPGPLPPPGLPGPPPREVGLPW